MCAIVRVEVLNSLPPFPMELPTNFSPALTTAEEAEQREVLDSRFRMRRDTSGARKHRDTGGE